MVAAEDGALIGTFPAASDIIAKALDAADRQKEQPYIKMLAGQYANVSKVLDRRGDVRSCDEILHRMESFDGHTFYRRLRMNGRALTVKEKEREQQRKDKFVEAIRCGRSKSDYSRSEGSRNLRFDSDLISCYRSKVVGREELNRRMAYLLDFEPKSKNLPVKRRIDYTLNNSWGKLWIDVEDYGVARVEFNLIKPVTFFFWLGKLTHADGVLQMSRSGKGYWLPQHLKIYCNGRIFFRSLHRRSTMKWSDFGSSAELSGDSGTRSDIYRGSDSWPPSQHACRRTSTAISMSTTPISTATRAASLPRRRFCAPTTLGSPTSDSSPALTKSAAGL